MDDAEASQIRGEIEVALRKAGLGWLLEDLAIVYEEGKQQEVSQRKGKKQLTESPRSRTEEFSERERLNILLDSLQALFVEIPCMARDAQEVVESVDKRAPEILFGTVDGDARTEFRNLLSYLPDKSRTDVVLRNLNEIRAS